MNLNPEGAELPQEDIVDRIAGGIVKISCIETPNPPVPGRILLPIWGP